jgi:hypothetical protein
LIHEYLLADPEFHPLLISFSPAVLSACGSGALNLSTGNAMASGGSGEATLATGDAAAGRAGRIAVLVGQSGRGTPPWKGEEKEEVVVVVVRD